MGIGKEAVIKHLEIGKVVGTAGLEAIFRLRIDFSTRIAIPVSMLDPFLAFVPT